MKFRDKLEGTQWWLSCIYGPSFHSSKCGFWIELDDLGNLIDGLWCVGGDFNEILYSSDRKGSTTVNFHSERFHRWVLDFSLIDIPLTNLQHTWSNFLLNASCSKVDRIFISKEWHDSHPKVLLKGLPSLSRITALCFWPLMAQLEGRHLSDLKICGSKTNLSKHRSSLSE